MCRVSSIPVGIMLSWAFTTTNLQANYIETNLVAQHSMSHKESKKKPSAIAANKRFSQGMDLYNQGRYQQAASIFYRLQKSQPHNLIVKAQLAKCLYRMEKIAEANKFFRELDLNKLDHETSYEYAQTFFALEQYDRALQGFKRVANDHALYDLSGYYGAICALKLKKYQTALDLIENAVVLPTKLVKSRAMYKKHIQTLLTKEEEELLKRQTSSEIKKMKEQTTESLRQEDPARKESAAAPLSPVDKVSPQQLANHFQTKIGAQLGFEARRQSLDLDTQNENHNYSHQWAALAVGNERLLTPAKQKRADAIGFQTEMVLDRSSLSDNKILLFHEPDAYTYLEADFASTGTKSAGVTRLTFWWEKWLHENVSSGIAGSLYYVWPEISTKGAANNKKAIFFLNYANNSIEGKGVFSLIQNVDASGEISFYEMSEFISGLYRLQNGLEIYLNGSFHQFTYEKEKKDGPDLISSARAGVAALFPYQVRLAVEGDYAQTANMRVHGLAREDTDIVVWNQQATALRLLVSASPFTWLTVKFSSTRQEILHFDPTPDDPVTKGKITATQYNFAEENVIEAAIHRYF